MVPSTISASMIVRCRQMKWRRWLYNFEKFSSTSEFYLSFDNVTDFTGKTEGVLEFVDENSFKVVLDDDNSSGSFGMVRTNGVHITNLDYGNSKDGHSTDFVPSNWPCI